MGRSNQRCYNIREAAERLGVSSEAVRMRIKRGTLASEKGDDGRTYVRLDADPTQTEQPNQHADPAQSEELVETLRSQVDDLREQLRAEREANRENRRLLAATLERIPELEAAPEQVQQQESSQPPSEAPQQPAESRQGTAAGSPEPEGGAQRSWWRRLLGM